MKHVCRTLAGMAGAWVLAGGAVAATISTPMLFPDGVNYLDCVANNVSAVRISTVTVSVIDANGAVLDTTTCSAFAPNDYCFASGTSNTGGYCRVVYTGAANNLRAAITLSNGATGAPMAVLPAQ